MLPHEGQSPSLKRIDVNGGAAAVSYDPQKWGSLKQGGDGIISLDHLAGAGCAAIIAESVGIPSGEAVDSVLEEVRQKHPGLTVLFREMRSVNGHEVCCLKYQVRMDDLDMIVYLYCHGGIAGTIQVRTCTTVATFDECESDFSELLNGLEIHSSPHPGLARARQRMMLAVRVTVLSMPVLGIAFVRFFIRTGWRTAALFTTALTIGVFAAAWIYGAVKYKLE